MDTYESIATKLDIREFSSRPVPADIKRKVLEAARLTQSGNNLQHWRFILVEGKENLKRLAGDSTSGRWVAGADFAVIVLTNPKYPFHLLDAGRVTQDMQLAAGESVVRRGRRYDGHVAIPADAGGVACQQLSPRHLGRRALAVAGRDGVAGCDVGA